MIASLKEIQDRIYNEDDFELIDIIYNKILKATSKSFSIINVIKSNFNESPASFKFAIDKKDWVPALHLCLKYCEIKERFEMCSDIINLINNIKTNENKTNNS